MPRDKRLHARHTRLFCVGNSKFNAAIVSRNWFKLLKVPFRCLTVHRGGPGTRFNINRAGLPLLFVVLCFVWCVPAHKISVYIL